MSIRKAGPGCVALLLFLLVASAVIRWALAPGAGDVAGVTDDASVPTPREGTGMPPDHAEPRRARAARPGEGAQPEPEEAVEETGPTPLVVRVIDASADPVTGAVVRAARLPGDASSGKNRARLSPCEAWPRIWEVTDRTGADGTVTLSLVCGRTWMIHAEAQGDRAADTDVTDPRISSLVVLVLQDAEPTSTLVRSTGGAPIPGAEVWALPSPDTGPATARYVAGPDGRVAHRSAGVLLARAPGFVDGSASAGSAEIVLAPSLSVVGVVVDPAGLGVEEATVSGAGVETVTDAVGRFELHGLRLTEAAGPFELNAAADGFLPWKGTAWPASAGMRIEVFRGGTIRGRVVDPDGGVVGHQRVEARCGDDRTTQVAGPGGEFTLHVIPGTWRLVVAAADGYDRRPGAQAWQGTAEARVLEGGTQDVVVRVAPVPRSWVAVRLVLPDGVDTRAVAGVVEFVSDRGHPELDFVSADPLASAELAVPPGTRVAVSARVSASGRDAPRSGPAGAAADDTLRVIETVTYTGTATVASSGTEEAAPVDVVLTCPPVVSFRVVVRTAAPAPDGALAEISFHDAMPRWGQPVRQCSRRVGEPFEVRCPRDGHLGGAVTVPGHPPFEFTLAPPHVAGALREIRVPAPAVVRGRVIRASGEPATSAYVSVQPADGESRGTRSDDSTGRFEVLIASEGDATLSAAEARGGRSGDRAHASVPVVLRAGETLDAGDVVLQAPVPPGARAFRVLTGRVVDEDGRAVVGAIVHAAPGRTLRIGSAPWTAWTGPDGRFRVDVPADVRVVVGFERPGYGTEIRVFDAVAPGRHGQGAGGGATAGGGESVAGGSGAGGGAVAGASGETSGPAAAAAVLATVRPDVVLRPGGNIRLVPGSATDTPADRDAPAGAQSPASSVRGRLRQIVPDDADDDIDSGVVVDGGAPGIGWAPRSGPTLLTDIPPGLRRVRVVEDGRAAEFQVTVQAGETAEVRF